MRVKVTNNITYIEARKMVEQKPEVTLSTIIQSATRKPETKTVSTQVDENDKVITSSTKVLTGRSKKPNKTQNSSQSTTPKPKSTASTPKPSTSQVEPAKNRESRSKNRTSPRKKSQSPKKNQRDKIKLTRVQDEPIKLKNTFSDLEQMEAEEYSDQKSRKDQTK